MRKKLFTFLLALAASVGLMWAMPTEFANCYDCQREPAFPTKSEPCELSGFDWPMVGNNSSIGPWKIEFVEYYNSSSTEYDFSINSDLADLYGKTPEQMEIYRLYQWNESAGEYQHAAYGVLCAYANESNPVEHAALFVADGRWGCYLTGEVHNGGSINITFDEDASTGFADLHPAPAPAGNSVTINESAHGSVVVSSSSAAAGETITLTATPDDGYQLKSISGVYETQATSSETLNATSETVNGNKFQAQATSRNLYGWRVYNPGTANTLTVSSKDGATLIEKIEFTSTWGAQRTNDMLSVSAGTLSFDESDPSTTVTINDINATSVTISGSGNNGAKTWCINSVKVYYTATIENELEISDTENANVKTFTMVDSEVTISAEFEPAPAPTPSGDGDKLSGAFSVDASKVIYFSKGNLQYTGSWQFAANQWDVIGASQTDDNRDLFSWGTGDAPNWENNMGGDWRTLTKDEWKYLFLTRDNAATLFALGKVNGKKGVILLPDAWVLPDGASFNASSENGFEKMGSTYYDDDYTNDHFQDNTYTTEQWAVMESAGAVFLPAAGYRESSNSNIYYVGDMGYYWSATPNDDEAYYISFSSEYLGTQNYNPRNDGRSVRLVSETAPGSGSSEPETPTTEEVATNTDPQNPSYHYSTFFHSTQNYKLTNDGTQAFIADLSGSDLVLTEIAHGEQVIPANTAVILRKAGSAEPVVLAPTAENGVSVNPDENSLEGVDVATPLTDIDGLTATNCYVLSGKSHDETVTGVGFYRIYGNTLKAHKAYVKYVGLQQNAPRRMRFVFNQATDIDEITNDQSSMTNKILRDGQLIILKNGVMYNAQGQVVK